MAKPIRGWSSGLYVHVVEPGPLQHDAAAGFARRLSDANNVVLGDTLLLRLKPIGQGAGRAEAEPDDGSASPQQPAAKQPTELRVGANGHAVRAAQQQLNRVHADLVALSLPGLPGAPLPVDGHFTARMQQAVRAFQQQVFGDPSLWDGVLGSATKAKLDQLIGPATSSTTVQVELRGRIGSSCARAPG